MKDAHLSDEAVAAFADGVLRAHARERAQRHTALCPECAHAVAVQREAVWALRAAPAPALPIALLDRLREVPLTTPIKSVTTALADDGTTMFAAFGVTPAAAFVPTAPTSTTSRSWHLRPLVITTAAVAAASVLTVGSASASGQTRIDPSSQQVVSRDARTAVPAP
jgi:anti-sigma factor RsiW